MSARRDAVRGPGRIGDMAPALSAEPRSPRRGAIAARLSTWAGPATLAAYLVWQFGSGSPVGIWAVRFLALVAVFASSLAIVRGRASVRATTVMALEVLAGSLLNDWQNSTGGMLRDLRLYLNAGDAYVHGGSVYTVQALQAYPSGGLEHLPFLYAPPTLPVLGILAALPYPLTALLWMSASAIAVLVSLRAFGLTWRLALIAVLWSPIEQGLFTGNVVVLTLPLLALAPRVTFPLGLGPLLKPQNAVLGLWLIRERAWTALARTVGVASAAIAITVPLTGLDRWREWIAGLLAYQDSQRLHQSLYGVGLGRWLPTWLFLALAAIAILAALAARGKEGLARLGLASLVASPSLWSHGFLFAIPAFLRLRPTMLWLAAGLLCAGAFPGPQAALAIAALAWCVPSLRRGGEAEASEDWHPLGAMTEPREGAATDGNADPAEALAANDR